MSKREASYEKVFIISNLDLTKQYQNEQSSVPDVYAAFIRRIHKVIKFMPDGSRHEYATKDYLDSKTKWVELADNYQTQWSETEKG